MKGVNAQPSGQECEKPTIDTRPLAVRMDEAYISCAYFEGEAAKRVEPKGTMGNFDDVSRAKKFSVPLAIGLVVRAGDNKINIIPPMCHELEQMLWPTANIGP